MLRRCRTTHYSVVLALTVTLGCTNDQGRSRGDTSAPRSDTPPVSSLGLERIAVLQDEEEPASLQTSTVVMREDGSVIAAVPREQTMLVFDSTGSRRGRLGRRGSGPGEFRFIDRVLHLSGDTVAVYDAILRRLSFVVGEAVLERTVSAADWSAGNGGNLRVAGRMSDGRWVVLRTRGIQLHQPGDVVVVDTPIVMVGRTTDSLTPLFRLPVRHRVDVVGPRWIGQLSLLTEAPGVLAVCHDGIIVADTSGTRYYDARGALQRTTSRPVSRTPTAAMPGGRSGLVRTILSDAAGAHGPLAERTIRLWVAQLDSSMSTPLVDTDGAVWWRARRDNASAYLTTDSARTPHVWMKTGDAMLAARGSRAVFAVWDSTDEVQRFELRRLVSPPNRAPRADAEGFTRGPCSPNVVF
jgi:hypothetical protein